MKKLYLLMVIFLTSIGTSLAQREINNGSKIGFQLGKYDRDFNIGLQLTSPGFWHNGASLRLRTDLGFLSYLKDSEEAWSSYGKISLGLVGIGGHVSDQIRLYGEGGLGAFILPANLSESSFQLSPYGLFGFEFYLNPSFHYFLEAGASTGRVRADRIEGKPFVGNGMVIQVGLRVALKK